MKGKVCMVTGANSGIGFEIVRGLAGAGARVIMVCRSKDKGERAREKIGGDTELMVCDLSSQEEVRQLAQKAISTYDSLDVLINNAGMASNKRLESVDGIEMTFATNVLSYYMLSQLLLPLLRSPATSRIVHVASDYAGQLDLDDVQLRTGYTGRRAYQASKQADRMISHFQAEKLAGSGVTVNCMSPGLTKTAIFRDQNFLVRLGVAITGKSAARGADTAFWLATSKDVEGVTGQFYVERKKQKRRFHDQDAMQRLWDICFEMTGV